MFELLYFFRGAISLSDYEVMSWMRRERAVRFMRDVQDARKRASERAGRG
jgi:hypothetical protein